MAANNYPTQARLKELLEYNPVTGVFIRLSTRPGNAKRGDRAGWINGDGYIWIRIDNHPCRAHKLAFIYMIGRHPDIVDHIDHNRMNNAWGNLREVSCKENSKNLSRYKNNKSGYTGVRWNKHIKKYVAYIRINRKLVHLGCFDSIKTAKQVRRQAETKYGFHENHGKRN